MSSSLHNTLRDCFFLYKNKTSEFCFNCSALGGSKATLLRRFCGFVTCRRAKDILHNPPLRKNREAQESEKFFHVVWELKDWFFFPLRRIIAGLFLWKAQMMGECRVVWDSSHVECCPWQHVATEAPSVCAAVLFNVEWKWTSSFEIQNQNQRFISLATLSLKVDPVAKYSARWDEM